MTQAPTPQDLFRATMSGEETESLRQRRFVRRIPTGPRCKSCNAPFGSPGEAGEVIVSAVAASAANLETDALERRHLTLKGRSEPVDTFVLAGPS